MVAEEEAAEDGVGVVAEVVGTVEEDMVGVAAGTSMGTEAEDMIMATAGEEAAAVMEATVQDLDGVEKLRPLTNLRNTSKPRHTSRNLNL